MNKLFLVVLILFVGCKSSTDHLRPEGVFKDAKGDAPKVVIIDKTITAQTVGDIMNYLASDKMNGRSAGSPEINEAASYIETIFKENNIKPYFSSYRDTLTNFDKPAFNVVGVLEGSDPKLKKEYIVIGAHYDHIGKGQPVANDSIANGANDNAAGTTAVLELAKYFGNARSNKRSLLFVTFSAEENGLLGSKHLASKLKEAGFNLYTMVNFEMIGVPMTTPHKAYLTGFEESNMAARINEYAGKELIGFLPQAKEYQLFKRSDNYPFFLEFNKPAQTISTFDFTNYTEYHKVGDEVGKMDFNHMAGLINDMIPVLEKMAGTPEEEIKMNQE